jgi:hypothetical protein
MEQASHTSSAERSKRPKFVRWAVMLGIVIVLNLFFVVARSVILPAPQYADYCPAAARVQNLPQNPQTCDTAGGIWTDLSDPTPSKSPNANAPMLPAQGYCDLTVKCQPLYDAAYQKYKLYSFIIEIGLGILAIVVGVAPLGSSIVSTGLSYGGVLAFVIAAAQYWTEAGDLLRLGISFVALAALLYIGLKRFRD